MTTQQSLPILSASMHLTQFVLRRAKGGLRRHRAGVFMVSFALAAVLQCALLGANPGSYHTALQEAQKQQRPLLVLVGANWCPGCNAMKTRVLPGLARRGALRGVS